MRAPFTYFGGKMGMAQRIVDLLPPHKVYLEPFFGCGAVLFAKEPSRHEIINDADQAIVTFFRVLRERPRDLVRVCSLTPYSRAEFEASADLDGLDIDDLERARRFWVRVNQSFSKTAGRRTGWSITTARTQSGPHAVRGRIGRFLECAERLSLCTVECCSAVDLITARGSAPDTAIYADPPYLTSTRNSRSMGADDYRFDMGSQDAHEQLAEVLQATPATVVLSGYPSPLYESLYADWWSMDVARTAPSRVKGHARRVRTERIWSNRDVFERDLFAAGVLA